MRGSTSSHTTQHMLQMEKVEEPMGEYPQKQGTNGTTTVRMRTYEEEEEDTDGG